MPHETAHRKVMACHLQRDAYLYIRQSSMGQVINNRESAIRQYDFRRQAVALGWPQEQIRIIDCDQGESGAVKDARDGFDRLVTDVSMGRAGIVMALEVSRLSRNSSDWHRLLEICAFTDTLVMDQDGLYELADFNDRLLLGLKGVTSEAELHVLKSRMQQGLRNKARRGELKVKLPTGLAYDPADRVVLDPNAEVQQAFRTFFEMFSRIGSAQGTVKEFCRRELLFPRRTNTGELIWAKLTHSLALGVLHNPRYAGAFCFGRHSCRTGIGGRKRYRSLSPDEWQVLIRDKHSGYITWEQYEQNTRKLTENARANGQDRRHGPPREGTALLQGIAICGVCGQRMTVSYHHRNKKKIPDYSCINDGVKTAGKRCQQIPGATIEQRISELVLEMVTPLNLRLAVDVRKEIECRLEEADKLRHQHVERARYEADLAKRRYMRADPDNRLVADVLEAEWNDRLRELADAQETYEKEREHDRNTLGEEEQRTIMELATDLPRLWNDPNTSSRDRKRIVRLLIEDVTILRSESTITLQVRFKGGAAKTLQVPVPLSGIDKYRTPPETLARIDELLDRHTCGQAADILNREKHMTGTGRAFTTLSVRHTCRRNRLLTRRQRLLQRGLVPPGNIARTLGIHIDAVAHWRRKGVLQAEPLDDNGHFMYCPPNTQLRHYIRDRQKYRSVTQAQRRPPNGEHHPTEQ